MTTNTKFLNLMKSFQMSDSKEEFSTSSDVSTNTQYISNGKLLTKPKKPIRIQQPTYQIASKNPFNIEQINVLVKKCTLYNLKNSFNKYNAENATKFINELSNDIKMRIKLLNFDRYRIVVIVNVMEKVNQSMNWKIQFLWESERDLWTFYRHETNTFVITVIVCGIYLN